MSRKNDDAPLRQSAKQRPGGRTLEVTQRIFDATVTLIEEEGFAAVTFQKVAERAGVGRATLYRRWNNSALLVADALAATATDRIQIPDEGALRADLFALLGGIGKFLESPTGKASLAATLAARQHPGFEDHARQLWQTRASEVMPVFERAKQRGELSATDDAEALFSLLAGSLYLRVIVMAQPISADWVERVVRQALKH